jgi:hypothetical protein
MSNPTPRQDAVAAALRALIAAVTGGIATTIPVSETRAGHTDNGNQYRLDLAMETAAEAGMPQRSDTTYAAEDLITKLEAYFDTRYAPHA